MAKENLHATIFGVGLTLTVIAAKMTIFFVNNLLTGPVSQSAEAIPLMWGSGFFLCFGGWLMIVGAASTVREIFKK